MRYLSFFLFFTLLNCTTLKKDIAKKTILFKVERTQCLGKCPAYKLVIFNDGTVSYNGLKNVNRLGKENHTLNSEEFISIKNQLKKLPFSSYLLIYGNHIRDLAKRKFIYKGKEIKMNNGMGPKSLVDFLNQLEKSFSIL
jgi:hypothetical protein